MWRAATRRVKLYHLAWILLVSYLINFVWPVVTFAACLLGEPMLGLQIGLGAVFLSVVLKALVSTWIYLKGGEDPDHSKTPEGVPVEPAGIWVDADTPLGIGSRVLAFRREKWYRGIVVGVRSRDRFLIRFVGWDPFWDGIYSRNELQIDYSDKPSPDNASFVQAGQPKAVPPFDDTAVRA